MTHKFAKRYEAWTEAIKLSIHIWLSTEIGLESHQSKWYFLQVISPKT